jgi:hypothetical protein
MTVCTPGRRFAALLRCYDTACIRTSMLLVLRSFALTTDR